MATRAETSVVYGAGVVQGIALVTFLVDGGVELPTVYALGAIVAVGLGAWSFVVARRRPAPTSVHPVPG